MEAAVSAPLGMTAMDEGGRKGGGETGKERDEKEGGVVVSLRRKGGTDPYR